MPSLEHFITFPENKLAQAAVEKLVADAHDEHAPLIFLHGPTGTGKTLLLRHARKSWKKKNRGRSSCMISAEEFIQRYAQACEEKLADRFVSDFLKNGLLIVEDLQAIEGKPAAQRALSLLLDECSLGGIRAILSADRPPGQINGLQRRLLSRIRGGLVVILHQPSQSSRDLLLREFASRLRLDLPDNSRELLARSLRVSPRELQAVVRQLDHQSRTRKKPIDRAFTRQFLKESPMQATFSLKQIARVTAKYFGIREEQLFSTSRQRELVSARRCSMALAAELSGMTHTAIARYFGRDNHSCVSQACRQMKQHLAGDPAWKRHWSSIHRLLKTSDMRSAD